MKNNWPWTALAVAVFLREVTSFGIVMGPWAKYFTVSAIVVAADLFSSIDDGVRNQHLERVK